MGPRSGAHTAPAHYVSSYCFEAIYALTDDDSLMGHLSSDYGGKQATYIIIIINTDNDD